MLLTVFVIAQLVVDVALLVLVVAVALRRRPAPAPASTAPPEWYAQFLLLAQDLMTVAEPLLETLETPRAAPAAPAAATPADAGPAPVVTERHREAFAQLRAGLSADEVGRRANLMPAEVRLMRNLVRLETTEPEDPRGEG